MCERTSVVERRQRFLQRVRRREGGGLTERDVRLIEEAWSDGFTQRVCASHSALPANLTRRQLDVLRQFAAHVEETGIAPTLDELRAPLGIKKTAVFEHVVELERKGCLFATAKGRRGSYLLAVPRHLLLSQPVSMEASCPT